MLGKYDCDINLVFTKNQNLINKSTNKIIFTDDSFKKAINKLESKGYLNVLVIGGGTINSKFVKEGLIDEIIFDIHPIILGDGVPV